MTASLRSGRKPTTVTYEVVDWSQHWRRIGGRWYRDAIARRASDGSLRLVSFPDGVAA